MVHRLVSVFLFASTLLLLTCSGTTTLLKPKESTIRAWDAICYAGYRDTAYDLVIGMFKGNRFVYNIRKTADAPERETSYAESFKLDGDTIYLNYYNGVHPEGYADHLVIEASHTYLIQYFINGRKRIFLRSVSTTLPF